jgi:hypothetical protein
MSSSELERQNPRTPAQRARYLTTLYLPAKAELSGLDPLKAEAYQAARKLIDKDVREKVKAEYPNDCHFGKFTFGYDVAWNYFSYSLEIVRTRKNGYRLVRVLCKTTWEIGWCKRKESGDLSMNISGSRIPYSIPNPALR